MSRTPRAQRLRRAVADFLALKTALGRKYVSERRTLEQLIRHAGPNSVSLTPKMLADWCLTLVHLSPAVRGHRLRLVRNFCLYWRRTRPDVAVLDHSLIPRPQAPVRPYIFRAEEVARLVARARRLPRRSLAPLRSEVLALAIVLLYCTGLRRGELLRLVISDYDAADRTLLVRASKFHKSRILPLSTDASEAIERYLRARCQRRLAVASTTPLVWNGYDGGRAYTPSGLTNALRMLYRAEDVRKPDGRPPRIHDYRHTFAVHALLRWYRAGENVQVKLPYLSIYMGHVSIVSTERYLPFVAGLAGAASALFERSSGKLVTAGLAEAAP
jgi:integrase/recombinase XerD